MLSLARDLKLSTLLDTNFSTSSLGSRSSDTTTFEKSSTHANLLVHGRLLLLKPGKVLIPLFSGHVISLLLSLAAFILNKGSIQTQLPSSSLMLTLVFSTIPIEDGLSLALALVFGHGVSRRIFHPGSMSLDGQLAGSRPRTTEQGRPIRGAAGS